MPWESGSQIQPAHWLNQDVRIAMRILILKIANGIANQSEVHDLQRNTNRIENTGAAAPCVVNGIGISWQACAGHALDFDWLCHWLFPESGSSWLSWHSDLAN